MSVDAVRAVAELAAAQHRAFTRRQAADLHFDYRRVATALRAGWLMEPTPGVLVLAGSPDTWEQRLMVLLLAGNGHAVTSHRAAARLHGLDGFDGPGMATVEASVSRSFRLGLPDTVTHHVTPLDACDLTTVEGFACTTIPRTLADLGAVIGNRKLLRRALTSARRDGTSIETIRSTVERVHRPGPSGTGPMLRLLDAVPFEGRVPDSWFEELLAGCLADPTLPPCSTSAGTPPSARPRWSRSYAGSSRRGSVSCRSGNPLPELTDQAPIRFRGGWWSRRHPRRTRDRARCR